MTAFQQANNRAVTRTIELAQYTAALASTTHSRATLLCAI